MKSIIFSTPMICAILEGKKTQTRRVIKNAPKLDCRYDGIFYGKDGDGSYYLEYLHNGKPTEKYYSLGKPRYKVGDILWVRETWHLEIDLESDNFSYVYKADGEDYSDCKLLSGKPFVWKPSIHMPREAARLFLKITGVRVERLQNISEADCLNEGIYQMNVDVCYSWEKAKHCYLSPKSAFIALWNSINAKRGYPFDSGVWVWVYEFERVMG